jgi:MFS family permease
MLIVLLAGQFMALLDVTVVNVAMPTIGRSLHASGSELQLVVAGYTVSYAMMLITGARMGDLYGRRRMFMAGVAVFTLASLTCGIAPGIGILIAARFVQGAGAAAMMPQIMSVIQVRFDGAARARALSAYTAVLSSGFVAGQVIGGVLVTANLFGQTWRPVFLVNVPIGVILLGIGLRALPHGKGEPGRTLDLPGLALLTPAVLAMVLPLVLGQPDGWPAWGWALMAASVPLMVVFALAERRLARAGGTPLIPGRILALPGITAAIGALFVVMVIFGGFFFSLALHLQDGLGDSALHAGLTFAPAAAMFGLVSLNWRRLSAAVHTPMIVTGFVLLAISMAWLAALLHDGGSGGDALYLATGLSGIGMAAAFSPLMTRVLMRVPVELAADATGVVVTVNQLGIVVGVATFGTLYLNLAGHLPANATADAFRHVSAHAESVTFLAIAGLALVGAVLAVLHLLASRRPS